MHIEFIIVDVIWLKGWNSGRTRRRSAALPAGERYPKRLGCSGCSGICGGQQGHLGAGPGKRTGQRCSGGWADWPAMGGDRPRFAARAPLRALRDGSEAAGFRTRGWSLLRQRAGSGGGGGGGPRPNPRGRNPPSQIRTPLAHWGLHRGPSPAIAADPITPDCLSPGISSVFRPRGRSFDPMVQGSSP